MLTIVKYGYEAGIYLWPVPFPFSSEGQVSARLLGPDGQERELARGEYYFQDQNVVYLLQPGHSLILCLNVSPSEVLKANQARAISPAVTQADAAPVMEQPGPVVIEQPVEDERLAKIQAQLDALEAEREQALIAARAAEADKQIEAIKQTANSGADEIASSREAAITAIEKEAADAAKSIQIAKASLQAAASTASAAIDEAAQAKVDVQSTTEEAIARLEAKIAELEARLITAGRQQEAGIATLAADAVNGAASEVQINAGIATQAADDASQSVTDAANYARQSGSYAAQAQEHAINARLAVDDCQTLKVGAEKAAKTSQYWAEEAQGITRLTVDAGNAVSHMQWQISNMTSNGGIRCVQNEAELEHVIAGSYIINPFIRQTPTPAYGVWPVDDLEACNWDGFFILGPEFDGLAPAGPPEIPMPEEPDPDNPNHNPDGTDANGSVWKAKDWLPCYHTHEEAANV